MHLTVYLSLQISNKMDKKIEIDRKQLRTLLLYEFFLGHKAAEAVRNICGSFGQGMVSYHTAVDWFQKFKNGQFDLDDHDRPGRPVEVDETRILALIEEDPRRTVRELGELLGHNHQTIANHLHRLGKVSKLGAWVPHELADHQVQARVNVCMQLLTFKRTFNWLNDLVTGDEKWVLYVNHTRKRQWLSPGNPGVPTPKPDLHPKKVMISVFWNIQGIVHWEILPPGWTITADSYCAQLDRVAQKLRGKQDKVYFLHDNARPHIARQTCEKLRELGWHVLPHPPYSPDLAPTDYYLFLALNNFVQGKTFDDKADLESELHKFFSSRSSDFYSRGIRQLPIRWQRVVDTNGAYLL